MFRYAHRISCETLLSSSRSFPFMRCLIACVMILLVAQAVAHPLEASGRVSSISSGDTFMVDGFGWVHLADVRAPDVHTADGVHSKEFTMERLLNVQVFLDIDNVTGYQPGGTTECLVYLSNPDGTPDMQRLFNRIIVEAGFANLHDDENEFDPARW